MIYSILHSVSQVLVLAGLLSVFSTTLIVWLKLRKHMRSEWARLRQTASASGEKQDSNDTRNRFAQNLPLVLVAATGLCLSAYLGDLYGEFHRQKFVTMADVHILGKTDDYIFRMDVEDPDTHQRIPFMIRFCPDYEPTHEMQPGTVLALLKYERRDLDNCSEIARNELGYTFRRDQHGKPIRFDTR